MRKVDDGKKEKKIFLFLVANNVVTSRPPERRPTGTPHTRANKFLAKLLRVQKREQFSSSNMDRVRVI